MKEYLKMADVFVGSVSPKHIDDGCATEIASGDGAGNYYVMQDDEYWMLIDKEQAEYASHAINSHDELVAEVERLREHLKLCATELSAMIDRHNVHNMEDDSWLYDHQTPWEAMQLLK